MRGFVPKAVPVASDSSAALVCSGTANCRRSWHKICRSRPGPSVHKMEVKAQVEVKQFVADYGKLPESNGDKTEASFK